MFDISRLFVKIFRPDWIEVEFEDENDETHKDTLEGLMCRVFQHEMDHMNGVDFTSSSQNESKYCKRKLKRGKLKLKRRTDGKDMLARAS